MFRKKQTDNGDQPPMIKAPRPPRPRVKVDVPVVQLPRAPGERPAWQRRVLEAGRSIAERASSARQAAQARNAERKAAREAKRAERAAVEAAKSVALPDKQNPRSPVAKAGVLARVVRKRDAASPTARPRATLRERMTRRDLGPAFFAQEPSEVRALPPKSRVVVFGSLVVASLKDEGKLEEFVEQRPRRASPQTLATALDKTAPKLRAWVRADFLRALAESGHRVTLALDQFLDYGLKLRRDVVVIAGGLLDDAAQTPIDVYSFRGGRLLRFTQQMLPAKGNFAYQDRLDTIIQAEMGREGSDYVPDEIHVFHKLESRLAGKQRVVNFGEGLFDRPLASPVNWGFRVSSSLDYWIPAGITAGAVMSSATVLSFDYLHFKAAQADFASAIAGHEEHYAKGPDLISHLEQKKAFLTGSPEQVQGVERLKALVAATASAGDVFVESVRMRAESATPDPNALMQGLPPVEESDFRLRIGAPEVSSLSSLEQAKPILERMSLATGAQVVLVSSRTAEDTPGRRVRIYEITGTYPKPGESGV